ncbi:ankyrin repeat domain-containing protein [Chlorobium sp. BLA1]|uniref:ankyrin repeat domain-containing protein n=1 Tax=Candidatus Chlorobium masyuteum TaxID=2716876 RepID=UPI00141F36E9|nr:ankyrin repeat domain-containing protein [Candidatus Chlorobium masyuteum]NHQ60247.1 ankyrin repeat domain-containing protein [Candidatus Chlorobium masyuteum]NTU44494.1 ankyrin repeat domain-containing protein [Chlorobiaceae bacterium]
MQSTLNRELIDATCYDNLPRVRELLAQGADVNAKCKIVDLTPLHCAVDNGHAEIAKLLLCEGADVDVTTKTGRTPLHIAALRGYPEVVELLLGHAAKINPVDQNRETPLKLAEANHHTDVAELLRKLGGRK